MHYENVSKTSVCMYMYVYVCNINLTEIMIYFKLFTVHERRYLFVKYMFKLRLSKDLTKHVSHYCQPRVTLHAGSNFLQIGLTREKGNMPLQKRQTIRRYKVTRR